MERRSSVSAGLVVARLSRKGQRVHPCHVIGRQKRREQCKRPEVGIVPEYGVKDVALRPERTQRWDTSDGQPTDDEDACGPGHDFSQGAHPTHIALSVETVRDRSG